MTKTIIAITFLATILLILPIASIPTYAPSTSFTVTPAGVQAHTLGANCYAFIPAFRINFGNAFADAQRQSVNGVPGHLATLNSAAEEAFADAVAGGQKGWIGYTRDPGFLIPGAPTVTERDGFQWGWVTGETPVYTNWVGGGPNNANNNELYAENNAFQPNFWNDIDFFNRNFPERGYFAEFPGACLKIVEIDVKPGSDPNSYPCKDVNKEIPVAVLSDAGFDATTIDADTVKYGVNGNEAAEVHEKKGLAKRHVEDKNKDGLPDMVFHFKLSDTGFSCDDIPAGENSIILNSILTGTTTGGPPPFEGTDSLRLVRQ